MDQGRGEPTLRCAEVDRLTGLGFRSLTDLSNGPHCRQRTTHDLGRAHTMRVIDGLGFEQFGVRQQDPELVIQAMEKRLQIEPCVGIGDARRILRAGHACGPATARESDSSVRAGAAASRHSVSAKIRMDPPAVRTYSTLPAEIQL